MGLRGAHPMVLGGALTTAGAGGYTGDARGDDGLWPRGLGGTGGCCRSHPHLMSRSRGGFVPSRLRRSALTPSGCGTNSPSAGCPRVQPGLRAPGTVPHHQRLGCWSLLCHSGTSPPERLGWLPASRTSRIYVLQTQCRKPQFSKSF